MKSNPLRVWRRRQRLAFFFLLICFVWFIKGFSSGRWPIFVFFLSRSLFDSRSFGFTIWVLSPFSVRVRCSCSSSFHFQVLQWLASSFWFRSFNLIFGHHGHCNLVCRFRFCVVYLLGLAFLASVVPWPFLASPDRRLASAPNTIEVVKISIPQGLFLIAIS